MAVGFDLCPVQAAMILWNTPQIAAEGFYFFKSINTRVVTIGTAAHVQVAVVALQRHFLFVIAAATCRHRYMPGDTLLRGGGGRKANIEIAALRGKLAQRPHRDRIAHPCSLFSIPCSYFGALTW